MRLSPQVRDTLPNLAVELLLRQAGRLRRLRKELEQETRIYKALGQVADRLIKEGK